MSTCRIFLSTSNTCIEHLTRFSTCVPCAQCCSGPCWYGSVILFGCAMMSGRVWEDDEKETTEKVGEVMRRTARRFVSPYLPLPVHVPLFGGVFLSLLTISSKQTKCMVDVTLGDGDELYEAVRNPSNTSCHVAFAKECGQPVRNH